MVRGVLSGSPFSCLFYFGGQRTNKESVEKTQILYEIKWKIETIRDNIIK